MKTVTTPYFRVQTEHVLFGVRGDLPIPPEKRVKNIFSAPKRTIHAPLRPPAPGA